MSATDGVTPLNAANVLHKQSVDTKQREIIYNTVNILPSHVDGSLCYVPWHFEHDYPSSADAPDTIRLIVPFGFYAVTQPTISIITLTDTNILTWDHDGNAGTPQIPKVWVGSVPGNWIWMRMASAVEIYLDSTAGGGGANTYFQASGLMWVDTR